MAKSVHIEMFRPYIHCQMKTILLDQETIPINIHFEKYLLMVIARETKI